MGIITIHPLPDGSLSLDAARRERACKVADMAHALIANNAYADQGDAITALVGAGFPIFEIKVLLDDARQVAVQHMVEMEMGAS